MNDQDDAVEGTAQLALVEEEQLLPQLVAMREHPSKLGKNGRPDP